MACEIIGNCPATNLLVVKNALGPAAEGFTLIDLKEMVCQSESDSARAKDCPRFKEQRPQLQKKAATDYVRYREHLR